MTSSKILFFLSLSFAGGIFLESLVKIPQIFIWGFFVFGVFLTLASQIFGARQQAFFRLLVAPFVSAGTSGPRPAKSLLPRALVFGFCVLFLVLGVLRVQISEFNIANDKLSRLNGQGEINLTGIISAEPDVRDGSQKIKVQAEKSIILVTTSRYPEYKYLDEVKLTGKLETPMETEEFSYKNYLMKDHIYSVMGFPKIEIVSQKHKYSIFSYTHEKILFIKQKMRQSIQSNFLAPQSFILRGIILGDKSAVGQDIKDKFRITGLSHIIAVSGMHVAILSSIIMSFLLFLGFWRKQAFYGSLVFIFVYVVLVGLPPSAVRAGIMGAIYLAGQALGRQTMSSRIIVLAGALMLLFNPLLLFYDVGFQLSFLAVLGLIYLEPLVRSFVKFLINRMFKIKLSEKYENALMMFTVTISAQIFTLPIIIYNFGTVSFISPVTNALVAPIIYYIILFGFLSSVAGIIWGLLGWLIALPCYFLMTYFLGVIDIFSKPWAYKVISDVSWVWIFAICATIFCGVWFLNRKYAKDFI